MNPLIHVSFDEAASFTLRVPEHRLPGEDSTTGRICVTDSIPHSIAATPGIIKIVIHCCEIGYEPILHVYEITPAKRADVIRDTSELVPDGKRNHEMWLVGEPLRVERQDYRWKNPDVSIGKDNTGIVKIKALGTFIPIQDTDSIRDFTDFCRIEDKEKAYEIFSELGIKKILYSLSGGIIEKINKQREHIKKNEERKGKERWN